MHDAFCGYSVDDLYPFSLVEGRLHFCTIPLVPYATLSELKPKRKTRGREGGEREGEGGRGREGEGGE
jgi:hypothetical protein